MSELRKAAQQALKVLGNAKDHLLGVSPVSVEQHDHLYAMQYSIVALRAAIAQERSNVQPEPVAWMQTENFIDPAGLWDERKTLNFETDGTPLYAAPPQRKPLTDEEMRLCFTSTNTSEPLSEGWPGLERFARAIEKAHGIE